MQFTLSRALYKKLVVMRYCTENIFVFLLQFLGLIFSTVTPLPVWFASGTAVGFIFMRGPSILPGIFGGTFLAFMHLGFNKSITIATIFSLQALFLLRLSYKFSILSLVFHYVRDLILFIIFSFIASAFIAYFSQSFYYAMFANLNGILIIGTVIAAWDEYISSGYTDNNCKYNFLLFCISLMLNLFVLQSDITVLLCSQVALFFCYYYTFVSRMQAK